jgi:hypothetical protein
MSVLDGVNTWSFVGSGGMNPLRGLHSCFMDGD